MGLEALPALKQICDFAWFGQVGEFTGRELNYLLPKIVTVVRLRPEFKFPAKIAVAFSQIANHDLTKSNSF